jgi:hypothetical protein
MKNLYEMLADAREAQKKGLVASLFPAAKSKEDVSEGLKSYNESVEIIKALMTSHNPTGLVRPGKEATDYFSNWRRGTECPLHLKEALMSNDASIVFRRVISDVLMAPEESPYFGQDLLSKTVQIDGVRSAMFPALGAVRAFDVAEGMEIPEQAPSFTQNALELKVRKVGIRIAMTNEIIDDSMWDIFGLYVTMCKNAMKRKKEEKVFTAGFQYAHTIFNNTGANTNGFTTGVDVNGNLNGSISMLDIMELYAGLINNGYSATDMVIHPLTWSTLARDPRILFQILHAGIAQNLPMPSLDAAGMQKNLPFGGVNLVVSPQMPFQLETSITMNGSVMPACNVASILVVDRRNAIVILQRDTMHLDEWDDQHRDIHQLKMTERYDLGALDEGRAMVQATGIRLVDNHKPVFNVGFGPGVS